MGKQTTDTSNLLQCAVHPLCQWENIITWGKQELTCIERTWQSQCLVPACPYQFVWFPLDCTVTLASQGAWCTSGAQDCS